MEIHTVFLKIATIYRERYLNIYIYMYTIYVLNHFAVHQKLNTTLKINDKWKWVGEGWELGLADTKWHI